jgi:murein DD-endopeptidase MepM/ murein hydrolase activator NlpD
LVATQEKLAQTRRQLARQRETFAERSRASYVHGGSAAMVTQLLDVGDVSEFARSMRYVESVLAEDRQRVQRISGLAREVEATKQDLAQLQQRRIAQRTHAKSQRDEVARLVEEQRQLRAEVAAQRKERRQVMLALQADRDSHEQLVASLRQASQQIEAELAALAQREERLTAREQQLAQRQAERERRTSQDSGGSQGSGGSQDSGGSQGSGGGSAAPASDGRFQQPSQGRITSSFGYRTHPIHGTRRLHAGVDLAAGYGAPNYAAADGVVVSAGWRGGYGRTVVISHGGGLSTLYAHQSRLAVSSGQQVTGGQVVGYEGASGAVTGPHLHFEVRVNGRPRNPVSYLR